MASPHTISFIKVNDRHYIDSVYLTTEHYDSMVKNLNSEVRQWRLHSGSKAYYLSNIANISDNGDNCWEYLMRSSNKAI